VNAFIVVMEKNGNILEVRDAERWYAYFTQVTAVSCGREDFRLQGDIANNFFISN
jgi:hypothetical protein